jgi:hypothetical protein
LPKASLSEDASRLRILDAVKELCMAPFTLQDVVAKTGLPPYEVETGLAKVVRDYTSDIDVDEAGNLVYRFPPGLVAREDIVKADASRRKKAAFKRWLIAFFKAWTVAMVIVYFIIYITLLIAFLVALSRSREGKGSSSRRTTHWGGGGLWTWGWGSPFGYGGYGSWSSGRARRRWNRDVEKQLREGRDPYAMDRAEAPKKPSLAERTWYHLFGTEGIKRNPLEQEKELLTYLRAKKGFITNADIIALLGVTYDHADAIGTRLVATYEGEMDLTDDGTAVYRFPNLMLTGAPEVASQTAQLGYLWQVRQKEHMLRTHPSRVVPILNIVNIVLAFFTWGVIMPFFGWTGWGAHIGLVFFPLAFSLTFLFLGTRRKLKELANKRAYEKDSMRIAIFQLLFNRRTAVKVPGDERHIAAAGFGSWSAAELKAVMPEIANDLRGELSGNGVSELRVPRVWSEMAAVHKLRAQAKSTARVGRTVFTTREGPGVTPVGDVVTQGGAPKDALDAEIAALEKELQS